VKTGAGLGAIEQAHEAIRQREPIRRATPAPTTPTATLLSASAEAERARRLAEEAHLPLIGTLDEPTLKKAHSELSTGDGTPEALRTDVEFQHPPWDVDFATEASLPVPDVPAAQVAPPLLVDVTPLTLSVETVSDYCDTIIERNTPVPCERSRPFVTATDNQSLVRVRISQGEFPRFSQNTLLGELELSGLRPAPRGQVMISVSFSLDTDGILNVSATDVHTGRATSARLRLIGLPEAAQITDMVGRHNARAIM
jgi:molecular chaperone DnaK